MSLMPVIRMTILLGLLTAIFLAVGFYFAGTAGMLLGLFIALAINFVSYWFSDSIVLKMYKAKPLDYSREKKLSFFNDLVKKSGLPKPKTYIIDTEIPNAFATGRSPKHAAVAVTRGILDKLSKEEIEGVLAHELSHVKNRDTLTSTVAATLAGALSWLAYLFYFGDSENRNPLSFIMMFVFVPLSATLIRLAISRGREFEADRTGALMSDPNALADALEKISAFSAGKKIRGNAATAHLFIVNPFTSENLLSLFSTHPPTSERVARLRAMKTVKPVN